MQQAIAKFGDEYRFLDLPDPEQPVLPGVKWGRHDELLSPAFWVSQAWMRDDLRDEGFRLGKTLAEEVAACLLGGHGTSAEIGLAAYDRVRGVLPADDRAETPSVEILENLLTAPLSVGGRQVRYRFAQQRARYLAASLNGLREINEETLDDVALRNALCALDGIGPKTASWIVRNRRASEQVAILDVHIVRACAAMGVFPKGADPARRYFDLEERFLAFCSATGARASVLDAVMWGTMRGISHKMLSWLIDKAPPIIETRRLMQLEVNLVGEQRH